MPATGLTVFDRTLHISNEWVNDVAAELGTEDKQEAYSSLRVVLHALRDRLIVDEAVDLAAQLPMLLRGLFYEGWRADERYIQERKREEFVARVWGGLPDLESEEEAEARIRAVFSVLMKRVTEPEIKDVLSICPRRYVSYGLRRQDEEEAVVKVALAVVQ